MEMTNARLERQDEDVWLVWEDESGIRDYQWLGIVGQSRTTRKCPENLLGRLEEIEEEYAAEVADGYDPAEESRDAFDVAKGMR